MAIARTESANQRVDSMHLDHSRDASEQDSESAIDDPAGEWCPGIDCPPAVDITRRPRDRIPVGLPHITEIVRGDEQAPMTESHLAEKTCDNKGLALRSIG